MGFFEDFKGYVVEKEKELKEKAKEKASKVSATLKDSKVYKKAGALAIATVLSLGALTSCANPVTTKYTTLEGQKYKVVMYKGDDACLIPVGKDGKEDNKNTINVIVNEDGVIVDGEFKGSNINSNNNDNTFRVDEGNKVTQVGGKQNSNGSNNQGQTNQGSTNSGSTGGTYRVDEGNVVTPVGGNSNSHVVSGGASDGSYRVDSGNVVTPSGSNQENVSNGNNNSSGASGGTYIVNDGNDVTPAGGNNQENVSNGNNNSNGVSGGTFRVDDGNIVTPSEENQGNYVGDNNDNKSFDYVVGDESNQADDEIYYQVGEGEYNEPNQEPEYSEDEIHYTVDDDEPSQSYTVGEDENSNKSDEVLTVTVNEDNTIDFENGK